MESTMEHKPSSKNENEPSVKTEVENEPTVKTAPPSDTRIIIEKCLAENCKNGIVKGKVVSCIRCCAECYCSSKCKKKDAQTHKKSKMCDRLLELNKNLFLMDFSVFMSHIVHAAYSDFMTAQGFDVAGIYSKSDYDKEFPRIFKTEEEKEKAIYEEEFELKQDNRHVSYVLLIPNEKRTMKHLLKEFKEKEMESIFWRLFMPDLHEAITFSFIHGYHLLNKQNGTKIFINKEEKKNKVRYTIKDLDIQEVRVNKKHLNSKHNTWNSILPVYGCLERVDETGKKMYKHVLPDLENRHVILSMKISEEKSLLSETIYVDFNSCVYSFSNAMEGSVFPLMVYDQNNVHKELDFIVHEDKTKDRSFELEMKAHYNNMDRYVKFEKTQQNLNTKILPEIVEIMKSTSIRSQLFITRLDRMYDQLRESIFHV